MGRKTGTRRSEWNRVNEKALKRLKRRISDFEVNLEAENKGLDGDKYHRPGSMKKG